MGVSKKKTGTYYLINAALVLIAFVVLLVLINTRTLNKYYTDIITFNLAHKNQPVQGEIYISLDRVRENAQTHQTSFKEEIHRVVFHGALHLCGYRDKTAAEIAKMRKGEAKYLQAYL